ncbi:MAG: D-alanyl-D-alanine carboxypeptidase [Flavobacteriaceae bacterium]|jgi:D-alanyl-D-alanine carboxypeptidase/D-alanyl-D-alanine-endopeptidase (penicillin-binding protein 4)|nr:D-alanyl-D-alanine carboxypeptidase [Flavobacteriaceae bacterium]
MVKRKYFLFVVFICYNLIAQSHFFTQHFESDFYANQWSGFYLFDPIEKKELYNYQGEKYFIPASNTKIVTLYTGIKMFPDSIPALRYISRNDTLYISGTGDPTLLEPYFKERKVIDFLKEKKEKIALFLDNFNDTQYGPGWSWEDYSEYFSPERTPFPIYGNVVAFSPSQDISPSYFSHNTVREKREFNRELKENIFYFSGNKPVEIPFITSDTLTKKLLEQEINKSVTLVTKFPEGEPDVLYSIPSDSLFRRMMLVSDNFLAEQILLMGSLHVSEKMNSKVIIEHMLSEYLNELPQEPNWVDGSGLSRYNNFTPRDFVFILNKLYEEVPFERLISLFPTGGINGTIKNNFKGNPPYVFAKSGSMGQVYNLSGFLKTNSGKVLIFSFMNNNFRHSYAQIKSHIQEVLEYVRDYY